MFRNLPKTTSTTWLRRHRGRKNRRETLQEHFWTPRPSHHDTEEQLKPCFLQRFSGTLPNELHDLATPVQGGEEPPRDTSLAILAAQAIEKQRIACNLAVPQFLSVLFSSVLMSGDLSTELNSY